MVPHLFGGRHSHQWLQLLELLELVQKYHTQDVNNSCFNYPTKLLTFQQNSKLVCLFQFLYMWLNKNLSKTGVRQLKVDIIILMHLFFRPIINEVVVESFSKEVKHLSSLSPMVLDMDFFINLLINVINIKLFFQSKRKKVSFWIN